MLSNPLPVSARTPASYQPLGALDDKALVKAAQSGDSLAFIELCQRHSKRLIFRINRITKNWEDAEDALQETLLKAYRNLDRFENRCAFSSWLTSIGINSALMLLRRRRGVAVSLDDNYEFFEISESQGSSGGRWSIDPESHYDRREQQFLLSAAIHGLPHLLRAVTELRVDRDYSIGEIACALRISKSAVKSRLSRARSRLRETLIPPSSESDSRRRARRALIGLARSRFASERDSCGVDVAA
jgi:RNA polymerase sigma-70 factor (ECF subfamily)